MQNAPIPLNNQDSISENGFSLTKITSCVEGADALYLSEQADNAFICHVCLDEVRLKNLKSLIEYFNPDIEILVFPAWDCLPYDRVSPSTDILGKRLEALSYLKANQIRKNKVIILTTISAIAQKTLPKTELENAAFDISVRAFINPDKLQAFLVKNGFNRTNTVREPGEFAVRGGIIDIFPANIENPVRLDLFGNEVDSLKYFNPLDQMTIAPCVSLKLNPASEVFLNDETIARFKQKYRELFGANNREDTLYESISAGRKHAGMEHWLPLFYEEMSSFFDYLPPQTKLSIDQQFEASLSSHLEQVDDFYNARMDQAEIDRQSKREVSYKAIPEKLLYHDLMELYSFLKETFEAKQIVPFDDETKMSETVSSTKVKSFGDVRATDKDKLYESVYLFLKQHQEEKKKTFISCYSEGSRSRLIELFQNHGFDDLVDVDDWAAAQKLSRSKIGVIILPLEHGFKNSSFVFLSEQDIFGDRLTRPVRKKKDSENFISEASSLSEGDLVVHIQHGIGRYIGLENLKVAGASHDCVKLEYEGGDKLYVPVENIEMLTRYGSENAIHRLDKLGGQGWEARKSKVKKDLLEMAGELLKVAAARALKEGDVLEVPEGLYQEFVSRFPYTETEDQLTSIDAVIEDLHKGRPMDRLVCGDVGFGKTEVALRAAFVASMAGVQVAIVAPTTLLARQHYLEFTRRFKGLPIRVEQLSRLVSTKKANEVKQDLKDGKVEIVIGTHAVLAESIDFKQLGLLIVDEEQKFGVKQKERLKRLKENVHILTLTATPIPRTLQLALTGVRDLSLITTPPVDRLAVRTHAMPFDNVIIREALMREHFRGGQSFIVCPRISDLEAMEKKLKEIVPELKWIKAHGQMPTKTLEDRVTAYYEGKYDILLATNIIESGLDIPNANTMIVHRADLFGLSQLYQIRGRIGRSKIRGYAYLTYEPRKVLNKQAQERLRILETLDTLGAGFEIASHDMDLRGGGNLLGEEQSGHVKEIGIELYQKMLEEAVEDVKLSKEDDKDAAHQQQSLADYWSPQINLGTDVFIPESYIEDLNVRLSIYRRASNLKSDEEIGQFKAELIDRFGDIPKEVHNLLDTIQLKIMCKKLNIEKVEAGPTGAIISFRNNYFAKVGELLNYVQTKSGGVKLRPDQKLIFMKSWGNMDVRLKGITSVLTDLLSL